MRIRKNAKISALLYTNTNLSNDSDEYLLQKNLCQLNQSPWDVITFPSSDSSSSLHQFDDNEVYYNVNPAGNGSSIDSSAGAFESLVSVNTFNGEKYGLDDQKTDYGESLGFEEGVASDQIRNEAIVCGKIDEKGCGCERMVKNDNLMCDYHIVELQKDAVWTTKKSRPVYGPKTGTRARQTKKQTSTNPYEFYYYSGFGPSWAKKRGGSGSNACNEATKVKEMNSTDYDMGVVKEEKEFEPDMNKGKPIKMELANIDDDDNVKGKTGINGKKRGRKPIKARSLKSLM